MSKGLPKKETEQEVVTCGINDLEEASAFVLEHLLKPEIKDYFKRWDAKFRQGAASRGTPPYIVYTDDQIIYLPVYVHLFRKDESDAVWENNVSWSSKTFWNDVIDICNQGLAGTLTPVSITNANFPKGLNDPNHGVEAKFRFILSPYIPKDTWYPYWGKDYRSGQKDSYNNSQYIDSSTNGGGGPILKTGIVAQTNHTAVDRLANIDNYVSIPIDPYIILENPDFISCGPGGAVLTYDCAGPLGVGNNLKNYCEAHNPLYVPSNNYQGMVSGESAVGNLSTYSHVSLPHWGTPMETFGMNSSNIGEMSGTYGGGYVSGMSINRTGFGSAVEGKSSMVRWTSGFPGMNILVTPPGFYYGGLNGSCVFPWVGSNGVMFIQGKITHQYTAASMARLFLHEFGHGLGLLHTHQGLSPIMTSYPTRGVGDEANYISYKKGGNEAWRNYGQDTLANYKKHFPSAATAHVGYSNVDLTPPFAYTEISGEIGSYENISDNEKTYVENFLGYAEVITNGWKKIKINPGDSGHISAATFTEVYSGWTINLQIAAKWFVELRNFSSFWGGSYKEVTNTYGYTSNKLVFNPTVGNIAGAARKGPNITTRIPFCKLDSNGNQTATYDPFWMINLNWLDPSYPPYPDNTEIEHAHDPVAGNFECPCLIDPVTGLAPNPLTSGGDGGHLYANGQQYYFTMHSTTESERNDEGMHAAAGNVVYLNFKKADYANLIFKDTDSSFATQTECAREYEKVFMHTIGGYSNNKEGWPWSDHPYIDDAEAGETMGYKHFNCGAYARYNIGCAEFPNKIFSWGYYGFYPDTVMPKEFVHDFEGAVACIGGAGGEGEFTGYPDIGASFGDFCNDTPQVRMYYRNFRWSGNNVEPYQEGFRVQNAGEIYYKLFSGQTDPDQPFYNPYKPPTEDSDANMIQLMFGNNVNDSLGVSHNLLGVELHDWSMGNSAVGNAMVYQQSANLLIDGDYYSLNNSYTRHCFSPNQLKIAESWIETDQGTWGQATDFADSWPTDANGDFVYGTVDEANQMISIVEDLLAGESVPIIYVPLGDCPPIGSVGEIIGTVAEIGEADLCVFNVCNSFYEGPTVCNPFFQIMEAYNTTAEDYVDLIPANATDGSFGPVFSANERNCAYRIDNSLCFDAETVTSQPGYLECETYIPPAGFYLCDYGGNLVSKPFGGSADLYSLFTEDSDVYVGEVTFHNNNYFSVNGDIPLTSYGQLYLVDAVNPKSPIAALIERSKKFEILRKNILKMCNFA